MSARRVWPGAVPAVIVYAAVVAALLAAALGRSDGRLVYPLDDTYVHMAIARHVAEDGVWGVTSERFTPASSSPLWTGMLALVYATSGTNDAAPLVLNVVAGVALLVSAYRILIDAGMAPVAAVPWSLIVMFAGTVPTLTLIGMEHTLHALVTIWFIVIGAKRAAAAADAPNAAGLFTLAALVSLTRYEGLFAVACVGAALAARRRWRDAVGVVAAGVVPVLVFGAWSISQGGFLLPNSVMLKGVMPSWTVSGVGQLILFLPALNALASTPHLASLVAAVIVLALLPSADCRLLERRIMAAVFVGGVLLHMQFARAGWFFRYEAYLMVCGSVIGALLAHGVAWPSLVAPRRRTMAAAAGLAVLAIVALPIGRRSVNALRQVPGAVSNIFEQQYQAGLFLDRFYEGRRIAVNDVGAIGYLADVTLLDVYGLASIDVAILKRSGEYTSQRVGELAARDHVEIAVIYPSWLAEYGGIPAGWDKVGEWSVADNLVLGENGMSFYSVSANARETLAQNLSAYANRLPATVIQEGTYLVNP